MDKHLQQLEAQLGGLLEAHDAMLALIRRKREAIRQAKPAVVQDCTRRENELVQKIGGLETERQRVVAALTAAIAPQSSQPLRLGQIAERCGEPQRGRLLVMQARLLERMNEIKRESAVVRQAMEGLLGHMQGMVQMLIQTVAGGGTYGQRGTMNAAGAAVSSFNATA